MDILLEAARYLEKIEQGSADAPLDLAGHSGDGLRGGHLRLDPNLPISFQFHTYSSPSPNYATSGHAGLGQRPPRATLLLNNSTTLSNSIASSASLLGFVPSAGTTAAHISQLQVTTAFGVDTGSPTTGNSSTNRKNNNNDNYGQTSLPLAFVSTTKAPGATTAGGQLMLHVSTSGGGRTQQQQLSLATGNNTTNNFGAGGGPRRGRGTSESSDKDSVASSRHRELHKTLEKNRRAHLRHCFEQLKTELPKSEYNDKKTSHINIIHCAIKYIQYLKRMEWENEHEMERLARTKIRYQNQLAQAQEEILHIHKESRGAEDDLGNAVARATGKDRPVSTSESAAGLQNSLSASSVVSLSAVSDLSAESKSPPASRGAGGRSVYALIATSGDKREDVDCVEEDASDDTHEEVVIELETGEEEYDDDETTASECTEDVRDSRSLSTVRGASGRFVGMTIHA